MAARFDCDGYHRQSIPQLPIYERLTLFGDMPATSVIFTGDYLYGTLTMNGCSSFHSPSTVSPSYITPAEFDRGSAGLLSATLTANIFPDLSLNQFRVLTEINRVRWLFCGAEPVQREFRSLDIGECHVVRNDDHTRIEIQYRLPADVADRRPRNGQFDHFCSALSLTSVPN